MRKKIFSLSNRFTKSIENVSLKRFNKISCCLPALMLAEGEYLVDIWLSYKGGHSDELRELLTFEVVNNDFYGSGVMPTSRKHGDMLIFQKWEIL